MKTKEQCYEITTYRKAILESSIKTANSYALKKELQGYTLVWQNEKGIAKMYKSNKDKDFIKIVVPSKRQ